MKAEALENFAVLVRGPGQIAIEPVPTPEPKAGEVLIKTSRSLISAGTELMLAETDEGRGQLWSMLAAVVGSSGRFGYSNVGRIVAVGEGVSPEWVGARVVNPGSHSAYVTCGVGQIFAVPDGVDDEAATFTNLATTAMNAVRRARLAWGESVGVVGLGILGQLTVRLCALAGADQIFAINRSPERLAWLPKDGTVQGIHGGLGEARERILEHRQAPPEGLRAAGVAFRANIESTMLRLLDVVFEVTGEPTAIPAALTLLRPQGRFVLLSSPRGATTIDFHDQCAWPSFTLIGAHTTSHPTAATRDDPWSVGRHTQLFLHWLASGRLVARDLVSHRLPYRDAAAAFELLRSRREPVMGVVLEWA